MQYGEYYALAGLVVIYSGVIYVSHRINPIDFTSYKDVLTDLRVHLIKMKARLFKS